MECIKLKQVQRKRRKARVRKKIYGYPQRPRLTITRSLKNFSAQIVDDSAGRTLVAASTREADFRGANAVGGNKQAAAGIGKLLAERAKESGIESVTMDRNGYRYHGRVKAFADAAREAGLKF
jgi:large subunit ribosomal protein L18